jgi:hypothetical protein
MNSGLPVVVDQLPFNMPMHGKLDPAIAHIRSAVLITKDLTSQDFQSLTEKQPLNFTYLTMISDALPIGNGWVTLFDVGGLLGLEIRQKLLSQRQQPLKRWLALGLIIFFSPILIFLYLLLSLLIVIDSPGWVLAEKNPTLESPAPHAGAAPPQIRAAPFHPLSAY